MKYSLSHLADHVLLRELATLNAQDRATTAALLAHIAEVDDRRLYARAAYPSMFLYCVRELRMSEDTAFRRICVARVSRRFPATFPAIADGRLNPTAILLLAPYLTNLTELAGNDLLAATTGKTKDEIRLLLAERFPQPDLQALVQPIAPVGLAARPVEAATSQLAPDQVGTPDLLLAPGPVGAPAPQLAPEQVGTPDLLLAPGPVGAPAPQLAPEQVGMPSSPALASRTRVAPLSPGRFALQVTVDQDTHDQLRYAQALLGHAVPTGDVAAVLKRALDALVEKLEQRKFAKSARSILRRSAGHGRYVPAEVRRSVLERDAGQCTFVSARGRRCEACDRLEFDHVVPMARGGQTTASNLRLRCRAHNQYEAECTFGAGFMRSKRDERVPATRDRSELRG